MKYPICVDGHLVFSEKDLRAIVSAAHGLLGATFVRFVWYRTEMLVLRRGAFVCAYQIGQAVSSNGLIPSLSRRSLHVVA